LRRKPSKRPESLHNALCRIVALHDMKIIAQAAKDNTWSSRLGWNPITKQ
jgi:hypothetical protein